MYRRFNFYICSKMIDLNFYLSEVFSGRVLILNVFFLKQTVYHMKTYKELLKEFYGLSESEAVDYIKKMIGMV